VARIEGGPVIPIEDWISRAEFFEWRGRRIAFWATSEAGKPSLLLIHGYPTSSWDWSALWPRLAERFRLVAVDMAGFGLSDKSASDYPIATQADILEAALGRRGVKAAHVFAHDYGDTVAQELLARHNEGRLGFAMQSLVMLNGGLFPEMHRARPIQKLGLTPFGFLVGAVMTRASMRRALDRIFGPATKASVEEIDGHWRMINEGGGRRVLHRLLSYIPQRRDNRARWVGALQSASIPMRLIDGGADPVSGAHLYHYYRQTVPDADAVLLPEIGHYPHTEAPGAVGDAFFEFHDSIGALT
jgi:pimeloyl-ACP methyl ester carboxylesterase